MSPMALKELVSGSRAELMDRLMKKRLRSLGQGVVRVASRVAVSNAWMFIDPKDGLLVACRTSGSVVSLGNICMSSQLDSEMLILVTTHQN